MKASLSFVATVLWHTAAIAAPESAVTECTAEQAAVESARYDDIGAHRLVPLSPIEYAGGESPGSHWGLEVELLVDETGRVRCYRLGSQFGETAELNPQRRAWLQTLSGLRYRPFTDADSPRPMMVSEQVREVEPTERLRPLPIVPLQQVSLLLERSGCYGTCPGYSIEIHGDGRVVYTGEHFVDVEGVHTYTIPVADVQQLVDSLRDKDIWSSKTEYSASITDNPTYRLTIRMGAQTHAILDYVGEMVGMPATITEFEREIDAAAHTERWIRVTADTVGLLDADGFDFASPAGSALLWRAASHVGDSDEALLRLLEHGARADAPPPENMHGKADGSLLEAALRNRRLVLADALIAAGALATDGRPDQAKIDPAFRAAIASGRLAAVQAVWSAAGDAVPALSYDDVSDDEERTTRHVPVTLLLQAPYDDHGWEGRQIAQWLAVHGCDLHAVGADGRTLLHIAADADDVAFVRYLLEQGLDATAKGRYDLPALDSTSSEHVALLLLEAGSEIADRAQFRERAASNHWNGVVAWLDAHER